MMLLLQEHLKQLESRLPELRSRRAFDTFANDVYETAEYWCGLARFVLENDTKVNYPERAIGQLQYLDKLRHMLNSKSSVEKRQYAPLFDIAEGLLRQVMTVQPPKDGHLGVLRVIRQNFAFLQNDYGFSVVDEQPTGMCFSTGVVYIKLEYSNNPWLSCTFGPESMEKKAFWIHDLLFLNGDERYRTIPQQLDLNTEADVEKWFSFLSDAMRLYGGDLWTNRVGAFDRLERAQAERDEEYKREMDLRYGNR